jgi:hypothetical protein
LKLEEILFHFFMTFNPRLIKNGKKFDDETLAKLYKKESTQEREREKETRGKDQSPAKQTAQKRRATRRKGNH